MQFVQECRMDCERINSIMSGIHEKRANFLTSPKTMIKSNPNCFFANTGK